MGGFTIDIVIFKFLDILTCIGIYKLLMQDLANTSTSDMNSNSPHLRNMNNSNNVPPHQNSSTCLPQLPLIHYFDESVNFLLSHDKVFRSDRMLC